MLLNEKGKFKIIGIIFALMFLCSGLYAQANLGDAILGQWYTGEEKDCVIEFFKSGEKYSGKIVWLEEPLNEDGSIKVDDCNPDKSLRTRKIIGLVNFYDFKFNGKNKYVKGKVYDPDGGDVYSCKLELKGSKLKVRGYIGIPLLGRTEIFYRKL